MAQPRKRRVAMFVFNNGNHDQRVHKEAGALGRAGFDVRVYAFLTPGLPFSEERDGYTLFREDQRSHAARIFDDKLMAPLKKLKGEKPLAPVVEPAMALTLPPDRAPQRPCPQPARALRRDASPAEREHWSYIARINGTWAERAASWAPDLVQAHDLDALEAAVLVGRRLEIPVVYDTHELWSEQPFISSQEAVDHWDALERRLIAGANAVMTINEPLADILRQRYDLAEVLALHNTQELQPLPQRANNDKPIALYQGAYVPDRGLEEMIAAAPKLQHVRLAFRGFGSSEAALRALDSENRILWWDPVPGPEVVKAASQADIGLIPFLPTCLNHYLSTPNKLFEYMSAGLAIAGSDIPEIARFVGQYRLGSLFDPYSPSDIARALDGIVTGGEIDGMKSRARQATVDRWNWEHEIRPYVALIERLLS